MVRSRTDWRTACIAAVRADRVVITVSSPTGRNYRLRRDLGCEVSHFGGIPFLICDHDEDWRTNFGKYDKRW